MLSMKMYWYEKGTSVVSLPAVWTGATETEPICAPQRRLVRQVVCCKNPLQLDLAFLFQEKQTHRHRRWMRWAFHRRYPSPCLLLAHKASAKCSDHWNELFNHPLSICRMVFECVFQHLGAHSIYLIFGLRERALVPFLYWGWQLHL